LGVFGFCKHVRHWATVPPPTNGDRDTPGQFQHFLRWLIKGASLITSGVINDRAAERCQRSNGQSLAATLGPLL
jgi:hypothetical protein